MSMNLMRYRIICLLVSQCFLGSANDLFASISDTTRQEGYHKSIDLFYELSSVLPTNEFVKGANPNDEEYHGFQALSLKYSIHTDGRKPWEQLYAYPVWGAGLYQGFFKNDYGEMSNPSAAYMFMDLPLKRWKKWSLNWEMGLGVSFNWNTHDPNENQYVYPISTSKTIFLDLGINAVVPVGKHLNLKAGLTTSHFSNGGFRVPNAGMNMAGARVEMQYIFNQRPQVIYREIPEYQKEWEWIALIAPSRRQIGYNFVNENSDTIMWAINYGALNFSSTLNRQISHKMKFGLGADLTYNEAFGADIIIVNSLPAKAPTKLTDKMLVGAYGSIELVLGKVSLIFQPGYYLYKKEVEEHDIPSAYQRIGIKYHIGNNLIAGISIRGIYFSKAEFIEWTIGYRIKWSK